MVEDYDIWLKVVNPYEFLDQINTAAIKTEFENNCKARNIFLNGIPRSDFDGVSHLESAHEIWKALYDFYQWTSYIKELRKDVFEKDYMKFGEALDSYLTRFNKVLSNLRSIDASHDTNNSQYEVSRHFLNDLDMLIWEMKVTSIQESADMYPLTLVSFYTKIKTHEMNMLWFLLQVLPVMLLPHRHLTLLMPCPMINSSNSGRTWFCFLTFFLELLKM